MDRRNSDEGKPPHPPPNPDVFDDENALDPDEDDFMPSVSDGFRPANANTNESRHHPFQDEIEPLEPLRSHMAQTKPTEGTDLRRMATRNSIAKVPLDTTLQSDSQRGAHQRGPTQATPLQHRASVSSTASFATTANSDGPFSSGPSHPYGMYPQNTMMRNASISTTSTQQQAPATPQLSTGPSHPYGMYAQNVVEDEPPVPAAQTAIPVGFPGINTGFHRQIGPDGEEQDIVGPFGHTEQLPPYSRYPEEGPTKASMAAEASATSLEARPNSLAGSNDTLLIDAGPPAPPSPVSPVSPLAPIAPAFLPQQRPETQTGNVAPRAATTSESASLLTTTTDDGVVAEKAEPEPSIRRESWRRKRLWGKVPITVALCLLIMLLIFAVVLGAAIGTFLAKNRNKPKPDKDHSSHDKPELAVTGNTLFGATPIATPSSLPGLPTGQFSLPLGYAQESSPGCLLLGNQYSAWSCKMSFAPLQVLVNSTTDSYQVSLQTWVAPDGSIQYGLQPPVVPPSTLQLVSDLDYRGYGPAWHFSGRYDKVVVLQPDEFAAGANIRKRDDDPDKPSFRHRFQVMPGDNPWYCIWNSTYIEGYIYVTDNSTAASMTNLPTPNPSDPFNGMMTPTATVAVSFLETSLPSTTPPPTKRTPQQPDNGSNFRFPFPYPRIVKIEERRLPGAPQPYCQKMQLLDNGRITPASGSNGGNVIVWLQESDPAIREFSGALSSPPSSSTENTKARRQQGRRSDPSDACHCQWMFQ
ncbi:hypothetical protein P171DRAFT_290541 [Karstenula rhodostoma CBS 690.94]|uniref:DUF7820 domain-containing protein n=1 Tax=Karstenula rhodostoma CBS 690.94 TaxID=1392251 RepID=A0A9P4PLM6_9PLEO|nr:hypothetical protein P171DRAFT_290541 [Karstenula rhodostoma CBS 690.94]